MKVLIYIPILYLVLAMTGCSSSQKITREGVQAALEEEGYGAPIIASVLNQSYLQPGQVEKLLETTDTGIRVTLAGNTHLQSGHLAPLVNDASDEVRAVVAQHPKLNQEQIESLYNEASRKISSSLARNASVPEDILMKLRRIRKIDLIDFALNPKCPEAIRKEILNSGDKKAIQWLKTNDDARALAKN
ncbi:MAG: hypothetical protein ACI9TH_002693 [Kiritimatiellia bacterium]|jgi:hypothetical protein